MTDALTQNTIQAAVSMERDRCVAIILREANWLRGVMDKLPPSERNRCGREIAVLLDVVDEINKV